MGRSGAVERTQCGTARNRDAGDRSQAGPQEVTTFHACSPPVHGFRTARLGERLAGADLPAIRDGPGRTSEPTMSRGVPTRFTNVNDTPIAGLERRTRQMPIYRRRVA